MSQSESKKQPFLSLCMIVKNESANLAKCLQSAQPFVDEIVLVDTGSSDNTVEIATQFSARIFYYEWHNDFASARNYALTKVRGEWILQLDADEELVVEDSDFRQTLITSSQVGIFMLNRNDIDVPSDALIGGFHARIFRNLSGLKFVRRYHEQLSYEGEQPITLQYLAGVRILHYGNADPVVLHQKIIERDIPILEAIRQEEGLNLWLLDCLARNYLSIEQFDQAQACYDEAFNRLLPHLISGDPPEDFYWVTTLIHGMATQSFNKNDWETTRWLCQRGLEWCPNHVPLNYLTGELILELGFPLGAIAYFENCIELGKNSNYYGQEPFERTLLNELPVKAIEKAQAIRLIQ